MIDIRESLEQNRQNLENVMSAVTEDQASPTRHVMRLLLDNRIQEANQYLNETIGNQISELERQMATLKQEQALLGQLIRMQMRQEDQVRTDDETEEAPIPTVPLMSGKDLLDLGDPVADVRQAIFSLCTELAQRTNGVIVLQEAVEETKKRGIDLKSTRPGTSIGNMLFKSSDWTRVGDGIFRWNHYKQ